MKKSLLLLIIAISINAQTLKEMLNFANQKNELLKANHIKELSAKMSVDAVKKSYYPTVEIGGLIQSQNPKTPLIAGTTYLKYIKLQYIIYDGGARKYSKKQKLYELSSIKDANKEFEQSLYLQIIQDFYNTKSLEELIKALEFKKEAISSQYKKVKAFQDAGIVGEVELYQLLSALESVKYNINSLKLQKQTLLTNLSLKVDKKVDSLDKSLFKKQKVVFSESNIIKSLKKRIDSLNENANYINSQNNPKLNLSFEENNYNYDRTDQLHPSSLENQSKLIIGGSMKIFDGGAVKAQSTAVKLQALSLKHELNYKLKEQKNNFYLSKLRIKNIKKLIKSAKTSLLASDKNYKAILKKYNAGIIDNTQYLDALSQKTQARANYKKALNDLEIAYALYYFSAGKNIEGFLK